MSSYAYRRRPLWVGAIFVPYMRYVCSCTYFTTVQLYVCSCMCVHDCSCVHGCSIDVCSVRSCMCVHVRTAQQSDCDKCSPRLQAVALIYVGHPACFRDVVCSQQAKGNLAHCQKLTFSTCFSSFGVSPVTEGVVRNTAIVKFWGILCKCRRG